MKRNLGTKENKRRDKKKRKKKERKKESKEIKLIQTFGISKGGLSSNKFDRIK